MKDQEHKSLLTKDGFITIQATDTQYNLDAKELLVYGIIKGYTKQRHGFRGTNKYLAEWCNCSERTITNTIRKLKEKGLIRIDYILVFASQYQRLIRATNKPTILKPKIWLKNRTTPKEFNLDDNIEDTLNELGDEAIISEEQYQQEKDFY